MRPFISSAEDRERLTAEALSWIGTPYVADGAVKGAGCSCAFLPWSILRACGHTSPTPPMRGKLLRTQLLPAIREWLDTHPQHFARVAPEESTTGDALLINAGIGHLLLEIDGGRCVHCWQSGGAQTISRRDPTIASRIVGVWRPLRVDQEVAA